MLYKIVFTWINPDTKQNYILSGIKEGTTPAEAIYYFKKRYPHHEIEVIETTPII